MALTTPIMSAVSPFSADQANTFTFLVFFGNQVTQNRLQIQLTSNNSIVYDQTITSFLFEHTVPASTLTNGIEYKARVQTLDVDDNTSTFSEFVVFNCLDTPVVAITTIVNEEVNAQTVLFEGTYTQTHDTLQSYRYILYDDNQNIFQSFPEKFDGLLQQEISGLNNGETYFLELITISTLGMTGTSGLRRFVPNYIIPILPTVITLENLVDRGAIRVTGSLVQLIFTVEDGSAPVYIGGEFLDLTDKTIVLSGISSDRDFTFKIWARDIEEDRFRVRLYTNLSRFELIYRNDRFYLYKYLNLEEAAYYFITSDEVTLTSNDVAGVTFQQIGDYCNILAQIEP